MVEFMSRDHNNPQSPTVRRCGVDVSVDEQGTPHSAVTRTVLYHHDPDLRYETQIAFSVQDGIAQLTGFVSPDQPSLPHFQTIPIACEQTANIAGIETVEQPDETMARQFARGRAISDPDTHGEL